MPQAENKTGHRAVGARGIAPGRGTLQAAREGAQGGQGCGRRSCRGSQTTRKALKDERSPGRDLTLRSARTRWAWPGSSQALVASGQVGCESQRERSGSAQVRQVLVALRPGFSGCAGGKPLGFCHCECDPGGYLSFGWLRQERGSSQVGRGRREAGAGAAGCPEHGAGDPDPVGSRRAETDGDGHPAPPLGAFH